MCFYNRAEPVAGKRNKSVWLTQDDGVTPVAAATSYIGTKASRKLAGKSTAFASAIVSWGTIGTAGNAKTLAFVADGTGTGSVTVSTDAYTFHFQAGVTTAANAVAALTTFTFTGSYTGSTTLASPADVFSAVAFAGGTEPSIFVSQATSWSAAAGTLTNTGIDGDFVYQYTQTELDFVGSEIRVRFTRAADAASLDLSTKTTHCDTVIYDKFTTGAGDVSDPASGGNQATIAFVNLGGGHSLDTSGYPVCIFNYESGVTTVADFESDVVASSKLGIKAYGTATGVLADPADTFAATNLSGGLSYKQDIYPDPMNYEAFTATAEGSYSRDDLLRLCTAALLSKVTDFTTGTRVFRDLADTKDRFTSTGDNTGRLTLSINDAT